MKNSVVIILFFFSISVNAQQNQGMYPDNNYNEAMNCIYVDNYTMACYDPEVDANSDGKLEGGEWNNADPSNKRIIESGRPDGYQDVPMMDPADQWFYDQWREQEYYDQMNSRRN